MFFMEFLIPHFNLRNISSSQNCTLAHSAQNIIPRIFQFYRHQYVWSAISHKFLSRLQKKQKKNCDTYFSTFVFSSKNFFINCIDIYSMFTNKPTKKNLGDLSCVVKIHNNKFWEHTHVKNIIFYIILLLGGAHIVNRFTSNKSLTVWKQKINKFYVHVSSAILKRFYRKRFMMTYLLRLNVFLKNIARSLKELSSNNLISCWDATKLFQKKLLKY